MNSNDEKEIINMVIEKLFFNQIHVDFLKEMLWRTLFKQNMRYDFQSFYQINPIVTSPTPNITLIICKHIIGIHKSNIWNLEEDDVNKLETSEEYKNGIAEETWKLISIRDVRNEMFFLNEPLIQDYKYSNGSPILYYPFLFCVATICFHVMNSTIPKNYKNIFHRTLAFFLLLNNGFVDDAFAQLRTILEECFQEIIFMYYPEVRNEKERFNKYDEKNEEFKNKYKNAVKKIGNFQKGKYLDYGWLDVIPNYVEEINRLYDGKKIFPYSFRGIEVYLLAKLKNEYERMNNKNSLLLLNLVIEIHKNNLFKFFSDFVHSHDINSHFLAKQNDSLDFKSIYTKILESLYFINVLYEHVSNSYKLNPSINNVDVIKLLHDELIKSIKKCSIYLEKENRDFFNH